ncbi:hypothetical protein TMatcc_001564 [Talaromyces marneffei ATCC 18224]
MTCKVGSNWDHVIYFIEKWSRLHACLDSGLYVQSCLDTEITDTPLAYIVLYGNYSMDVVVL